MEIVPLKPTPSQIVNVTLADQVCQIKVAQMGDKVFVDLSVNNTIIIAGVVARNLNRIVRSLYLGFVGDLTFIDNEAPVGGDGEDPVYTGLGARFSLAYLSTDDLASGEG